MPATPGSENNYFVATKIPTHQLPHRTSFDDTIQQEKYSNYRVPDLFKGRLSSSINSTVDPAFSPFRNTNFCDPHITLLPFSSFAVLGPPLGHQR